MKATFESRELQLGAVEQISPSLLPQTLGTVQTNSPCNEESQKVEAAST